MVGHETGERCAAAAEAESPERIASCSVGLKVSTNDFLQWRALAPMKAIVRSVCFKCALVLVFLRFSFLHETIAFLTGVNPYLLYIFAPLALIGVVVFGGLQRTFRWTSSLFWAGFVAWMALAIPFSSWRGGSLTHVVTFVRTDFVMLLITAGLARTWAECRKLIYAIATAAIFNLGTAHIFVNTASGSRFGMEWKGVIANPDDLAAHLLLVLPFLLFIVLKPRTRTIFRLVCAGATVIGLFQILRTGSRGALVALLVTIVFVFVRGSARQRIAVGAIAPVVLAILIGLLPSSTWNRLTSLSARAGAPEEAVASSEAREYLLKKSIVYTLQKPLFGVGPGQFSAYEGESRVSEGLKGYWHDTHNSYTQISSECGIPSLLFYIAAAVETFRQLGKIRRRAAASHQHEIVTAVFCITTGLVAYSTAAAFVNFGYRFYFPAISGLVGAMYLAVRDASRPRSSNCPTAEEPVIASVDPIEATHPYSS